MLQLLIKLVKFVTMMIGLFRNLSSSKLTGYRGLTPLTALQIHVTHCLLGLIRCFGALAQKQ